jgi:hypothetical protein
MFIVEAWSMLARNVDYQGTDNLKLLSPDMDWNTINTVPSSIEEYYLKVEGETIRGNYDDFPTATHWTQLEVAY